MPAVTGRVEMKEWTGGINKRLDAWKINRNCLTVAINAVVKDGALIPLKALGSAVATGLGTGSSWKSIHKVGSNWIASTSRRWVVNWQNSYAAYLTDGTTPPKWTNGTTTSNLGLAAPTAIPTSALGAAGTISGTNLSHVITYLDALGQESAPSPATTPIATVTADKIDLAAIPTSGILLRKVYRTDASGTYRYVATLNAADTTYTDDTAVSALGDPLLTEGATAAPNLSLMGVGTHRAMLAGAILNAVYRSNPGAPYSWSGGGYNTTGNVVAIAGTGLGFLVLTAEKPYLLTGTEFIDSAMVPYTNKYGCPSAAAHSLAETDKGWVWWSPVGLILFTTGGEFIELMRNHYDQGDIDAYSTTDMLGAFDKGEYLLFHSGGTLRVDLSRLESAGPVFTESDQTANAVYRDTDGSVYLAVEGSTPSVKDAVKVWGAGSAYREMTVRFAELAAPNDRDAFHVHGAQIRCDGAATVKWYKSGAQHGSDVAVDAGGGFARIAPGAFDRIALGVVTSDPFRAATINPQCKEAA